MLIDLILSEHGANFEQSNLFKIVRVFGSQAYTTQPEMWKSIKTAQTNLKQLCENSPTIEISYIYIITGQIDKKNQRYPHYES